MIITKAPFRVSFFGGGSDIADFYERHGGAVLSTSINKFMYISSHHLFKKEGFTLKYSETEHVDTANEIKHKIFKTVLNDFKKLNAIEISSNADIPAGTGLGSSSSFTVALLLNLYTRLGKFVSNEQLAKEACEIEIQKLGHPIGKQDQYAAALGGFNVIEFKKNGDVVTSPVVIKNTTRQRLEDNLLMFYTGNQRQANGYLKELKKSFKKNNSVSDIQLEMLSKVWEAKSALQDDNLDKFASLLHENWLLKQQLTKGISNPLINSMYTLALDNGAQGGKLLGAGGSGFLLLYCEKTKQKQLRAALSTYQELSMKFDTEGAKVVYFGEENNR